LRNEVTQSRELGKEERREDWQMAEARRQKTKKTKDKRQKLDIQYFL